MRYKNRGPWMLKFRLQLSNSSTEPEYFDADVTHENVKFQYKGFPIA